MNKLALQADLRYNVITKMFALAMLATSESMRRTCLGGSSVDSLSPNTPHVQQLPDTSGIYCITCTATKKIYIGSTIHLYRRRKEHFNKLRLKKHFNRKLQYAWNKYGEQTFTFEVLEYVLPMSLTAREQYWFKKLKPFGRKGFNLTPTAGSTQGHKHTPESREKIRKGNLGKIVSAETCERISHSNMGHRRNIGTKHTPEHTEKIRQVHLGKTISAETREKLRQANLGHKYNLGHKHTPETRAKISQAKLGKKLAPRKKKEEFQ